MEEPVYTHITIKATLEKEFQILREAQKQHKEDLEKTVTTLFEKITATYEQHFQHLHETLDKQSTFLRREFAASLNWRLTHHHTEILKDIREFMTPVAQSVHHLQEDVWKLSQNMDNVRGIGYNETDIECICTPCFSSTERCSVGGSS